MIVVAAGLCWWLQWRGPGRDSMGILSGGFGGGMVELVDALKSVSSRAGADETVRKYPMT